MLRLLHDFAVDDRSVPPVPPGYCRAGAHVDWDFVTLLFQRAGQPGLETARAGDDDGVCGG